MSGTPLNPARFAGLMATVAKSFPLEFLTDEVCQSWENNGAELARRLQFLAELAPEPKRSKKKAKSNYNGSQFFQTRKGLRVDSDLGRHVGLDGHMSRQATPTCRSLEVNEIEATMFGDLGTAKHAATLKNACGLGQIHRLIDEQWGGRGGILLNDGRANIFPMVGKAGTLHVARVRWGGDDWCVDCDPFSACRACRAGDGVFSN